MFARTPLSSAAKSFVPRSEMSSPCQTNSPKMVNWRAVAAMNPVRPAEGAQDHAPSMDWRAVAAMNPVRPADGAQDHAPNMLHSSQDMPGGRTGIKEFAQRWPLRTPSTSEASMSHSDLSATAESMTTPKHLSSSEHFDFAVSRDLDDSDNKQYPVVRNTFLSIEGGDSMEQSELFRNSSTPSILLSCPFRLKAPSIENAPLLPILMRKARLGKARKDFKECKGLDASREGRK